jgi:misacylated tRNA(Ala) deacylase
MQQPQCVRSIDELIPTFRVARAIDTMNVGDSLSAAEAILQRMQAMESRVAELESTADANMTTIENKLDTIQADAGLKPAPEADGALMSAEGFHHGFDTRPPPKSHTTDLVACQRDSKLRTLQTTVTACHEQPLPEPAAGGSKKKKKGSNPPKRWLVELADTVLFPEGGGQPSDTGAIGGVRCASVHRTADGVVEHVMEGPLEVGAAMEVVVDWDRRFDHMQQHSSQHLISAVALAKWGIKTLSWELGTQSVTVELDVPADKADVLTELEAAVNSHVREAAAITWEEFTREALALDSRPGLRASAKSLPPDVQTVRIIEIAGVDINPCCGTHLGSTAEMQVVKFTTAEPRKGKTVLHFATGGRVLKALAAATLRDRGLNKVLSCGPDEFVAKVEKLTADGSASQRVLRKMGEELATLLGESLAAAAIDGVATMHREDASSMPFLQLVAATVLCAAPPLIVLLTSGSCTKKGGTASFLLVSDGRADGLNKEVAAALGGRGGGKNGSMQGKTTALTPNGLAEARGMLCKLQSEQ